MRNAGGKLKGFLIDRIELGGPGAFFAQCNDIGEIVRGLLDELDLDEALSVLDLLKAELMKVAADRAKLVS